MNTEQFNLWITLIFCFIFQDFSILVHDCSVNENHCDSLSPQNITRTVTPPKSQACEEVKMIYLPEINLQDFDEVFDTHTLTTSFITNETATESTDLTSTPMFGLASDQREKSNELTVKTPPIHTKYAYHSGVHAYTKFWVFIVCPLQWPRLSNPLLSSLHFTDFGGIFYPQ